MGQFQATSLQHGIKRAAARLVEDSRQSGTRSPMVEIGILEYGNCPCTQRARKMHRAAVAGYKKITARHHSATESDCSWCKGIYTKNFGLEMKNGSDDGKCFSLTDQTLPRHDRYRVLHANLRAKKQTSRVLLKLRTNGWSVTRMGNWFMTI
jgi:hypothetical protein